MPTTRDPDAKVDGRDAYVVVEGPWSPGCVDPWISGAPATPGRLVFWLDQTTFVILKEQVQDASGSPVDQGGYFREVRTLDVGPVDPSVFHYTPPAGVKVKEVGGTAPRTSTEHLFASPPFWHNISRDRAQ